MLFELLKAAKVGGVDFYHDLFARYLAADKLPPGYALVESAYNPAANVLVNTGQRIGLDDAKLVVRAKAQSGSWYIFQARRAAGLQIYGITGSGTGDTIIGGFPGVNVTSSISRSANHIYVVTYEMKNGAGKLTVEDETAGTTDVKTASYTFASPAADFCIFGNTTGDRVAANTHVFFAKMWKYGALVMDYAPCVHENTVGFWDYVTKTFVTPTSGTLAAG